MNEYLEQLESISLYDQIVDQLKEESKISGNGEYQKFEFPDEFFEANPQIMRCKDGAIVFRQS